MQYAIPGSEVESLHGVHGHGQGSPGFENASTLVPHTYGYTFNDASVEVVGTSVSSLVEDSDDGNLGEIPFSRNADVRRSLHVDSKANQGNVVT